MQLSFKRFPLWVGLGLLGAGTAYAAQSFDTTTAGWTPIVTMWGEGDAPTAVRALGRVTKAYDSFLHRTEIDGPTQDFIDDALKELENFDLGGFHDLLPDERNGHRELNVRGELSGNKYLVKRAEMGSNYQVALKGARNGLADMSLLLQASERETDEHKSVLFGLRWGLGIGPLSYTALLNALRDLTRIATTGDPRASGDERPTPSEASRGYIRKTNPGLGNEDVDALALLYEAYPTLGKVLSGVGRVEDMRSASMTGDYYHVTWRVRAEPERLEEKYPAFAKHAKKLDDVLHADVRLLDDQGRNICKITVDSQKLQFGVEAYIKDGLSLPFENGKVFSDEPLDPLSDTLKNPRVIVNARLNMLGIIIDVRDLQVDSKYAVHGSYATADSAITKMPKLKVSGRALGMFSPGFLDVFIPGNIEQITREFFEVAVKGNGGKGIRSHIELGSGQPGAAGVIAASGNVEALENFLVKMAGGIVNDRLMMNERAEDEAKQLAADLHDAFVKDFARFQSKVGGSG